MTISESQAGTIRLPVEMCFCAIALDNAIRKLPLQHDAVATPSAPLLLTVGSVIAMQAWWVACKVPNLAVAVNPGWTVEWRLERAQPGPNEFAVFTHAG